MSRGWESKSVESQQAEQAELQASSAQRNAAANEQRASGVVDADRKRKRQTLEMQRERILSERTASPHRRSALVNALADIEEKLTELGWTIHL